MGAIHKEDPGTLAGRLRLAMEAKNRMNANQLAIATGFTRQQVGKVLNGVTKKLLWDTAVIYAGVLGIRPDWLQDGELPMYPIPRLKSDEEIRLIEDFRHMSPSHQRDLAEIAQRWAEEDNDGPNSHPFSPHKRPPHQ
jgi:hypothetical protein